MLLSDLFDQLTYGELSQLEYGGVDNEGILLENYKRVVPHVNLALTELHKRFLIREEEVTIRCYDHIETYILDPKYAATTCRPEPVTPTKLIFPLSSPVCLMISLKHDLVASIGFPFVRP